MFVYVYVCIGVRVYMFFYERVHVGM